MEDRNELEEELQYLVGRIVRLNHINYKGESKVSVDMVSSVSIDSDTRKIPYLIITFNSGERAEIELDDFSTNAKIL